MNVSSPGQWRRTSVAIMLSLPGNGAWNYFENSAGRSMGASDCFSYCFGIVIGFMWVCVEAIVCE